MTLDHWHQGAVLLTSIDSSLGAIAVSYLATVERLGQVARIDWQESGETHHELKARKKSVENAFLGYLIHLHETAALALAKAIEDAYIDLREISGFRFHPVEQNHNIRYAETLSTIWALANVIKHNRSRLNRKTSKHAKYLIDKWELTDGAELSSYIILGHAVFNIVQHIPKVWLGLIDTVRLATGEDHRLLHCEFRQAFEELYEGFVPEVLGIRRPWLDGHDAT